jgi:hypothetical protein
VAANIAGEDNRANCEAVPRVTYTDPSKAASVGAAEAPYRVMALLSEVPKTATYDPGGRLVRGRDSPMARSRHHGPHHLVQEAACFPLRRFDFPVPIEATADIDRAFDGVDPFHDRSRKALVQLADDEALAVTRACGLPAGILTENKSRSTRTDRCWTRPRAADTGPQTHPRWRPGNFSPLVRRKCRPGPDRWSSSSCPNGGGVHREGAWRWVRPVGPSRRSRRLGYGGPH